MIQRQGSYQTLSLKKKNGYKEAQWANWQSQRTTGKLQGTYCNYISVKKDIETINISQKEMKNTICELKNTVGGIKSRLVEAEDWTSELEDRMEKKTPSQSNKTKQKYSKRMSIVVGSFGATWNVTVFISQVYQKEKKKSKG